MINLDSLVEKYADNPYMKGRLHFHVNSLPAILETEELNREKRQQRSIQLTTEHENFLADFLNGNSFFFLSSNNSFYKYNGTSYECISENDLNYCILKSITDNGNLGAWKYKTKYAILKKIKQRPLFKSIPESQTIQNVLNHFYPTIFQSKEETKYFLTIVGDALLKKYSEEDPIVFLATGTLKRHEIETNVYNQTSISNLTSSIVTKYHDTYEFANCRLLNFRNTISETFFKENCIDFLCVCAYYSERFLNSETYLLSQCDDDLKNKVLYLKTKSKEQIFEEFLSSSFEEGNTDCVVSWKNIHYLWKQYTAQIVLPTNIIYSQQLKTLFSDRYESVDEGFTKLTSKLLPQISQFLNFWEKNIVIDETSELEIDEIVSLYRHASGVSISESSVLSIVNHYFSHVEIVENKYVMSVACIFWKKTDDITSTINLYKSKNEKVVTLDTLYSFYLKQKIPLVKMHVSKRFFKKIIEMVFSDSMELEACLSFQ